MKISQSYVQYWYPGKKYQYQGLTIGIYIAIDVFQEKISMLFQDMVYVCVYMDDLVITSNDTFENHMDILDDKLNQLKR